MPPRRMLGLHRKMREGGAGDRDEQTGKETNTRRQTDKHGQTESETEVDRCSKTWLRAEMQAKSLINNDKSHRSKRIF